MHTPYSHTHLLFLFALLATVMILSWEWDYGYHYHHQYHHHFHRGIVGQPDEITILSSWIYHTVIQKGENRRVANPSAETFISVCHVIILYWTFWFARHHHGFYLIAKRGTSPDVCCVPISAPQASSSIIQAARESDKNSEGERCVSSWIHLLRDGLILMQDCAVA